MDMLAFELTRGPQEKVLFESSVSAELAGFTVHIVYVWARSYPQLYSGWP